MRMRALFQICTAEMERPRLPRGLPELLDASRQSADDVTAGERGLHGCGRQTALKII
jgi:hypothetical protein